MIRANMVQIVFRRSKHSKTHWSQAQKKQFPKHRALDNFDDFYGSVFGARWKSIRLALLSQHKYMALVNVFGDTEETIDRLQAAGAINLRDLYRARKSMLANESGTLPAGDKIFKIDNKVEAFRSDRQRQEADNLYGAEQRSATATHQDAATDDHDSGIERVDYKKSLERTILDDSEVDHERIVDPAVSNAALHEFVPASKLKGMEDFVFESEHYKYYSNTSDFPLNTAMEESFEIPECLQLYTYERGNVSDFVSPRMGTTGVLSHFLLDGASVLPPLVLDVQPGERVLDACAAPGGKSLLLMQTLRPGTMVCNDVQESRVNRIRRLMQQYFYDFEENWKQKRCFITQADVRFMEEYEMYDRILVDVPCTTDRHSVMENDNNIFKPTRVKERLRLPERQAAILANSLRLLRPGGSLVYSTCSLSPVQNDGVVHMALSNVFNDSGLTVTVKDLTAMMQPLADVFKFANPTTLKYGQLVLPFLPANFGPMYLCKMTRNN